jgi:hypothetical protein
MRAWSLLLALGPHVRDGRPGRPASEANTRFFWGRQLYGKGAIARPSRSCLDLQSPLAQPCPGAGRRALPIASSRCTKSPSPRTPSISPTQSARPSGPSALGRARGGVAAYRPAAGRDHAARGNACGSIARTWAASGVTPRTFAAAPGRAPRDRGARRSPGGRRSTVTLERRRRGPGCVMPARRCAPGRFGSRVVRPGPWFAAATPMGPILGTTPVHLALPIGPAQLHLAAPGHEPAQPTVVISETATMTLDLALATNPSAARPRCAIETNVVAALVLVDGKEAGFSPLVVLSVPEGPHEVRVQKPGYQPYERGGCGSARGDASPSRARSSLCRSSGARSVAVGHLGDHGRGRRGHHRLGSAGLVGVVGLRSCAQRRRASIGWSA